MNRRKFLQATSATGLSMSVLSLNPVSAGNETSHRWARSSTFRTISYNILALRGFPARPENKLRLAQARPQMTQRMALELSLYQPDLITFQESPAEKLVAEIAEFMEMNYTWFPGGFPGTVMTRHQIRDSVSCPLDGGGKRPDALFTRHWGRATLLVNGHDLIVYSAHLHPGKQEIRASEVTEMLKVIEKDLAGGKNVILQGDLNMQPDNPLYERWATAGLQDAFVAKGSGKGLTINASKLRARIDYVWSSGPMLENLRECRVLTEGNFIDHPTDLAGFALSDHLPVMATFDVK